MSWFKRAINRAAKTVRDTGRAVDPTSTKSEVGNIIGARNVGYVRGAIGTSLAGVTGGATFFDPKLRDWAEQGYARGAQAGILAAEGKNPIGAFPGLGDIGSGPGAPGYSGGGYNPSSETTGAPQNTGLIAIGAFLAILLIGGLVSKD